MIQLQLADLSNISIVIDGSLNLLYDLYIQMRPQVWYLIENDAFGRVYLMDVDFLMK